MKKIDLHVHSTASDGVFTPSEIIHLAVKKKLAAISIADHDTVAGIREAASASFETRMLYIPSVEISVEYPTGDLHLLGYFADPDHKPLADLCADLAVARQGRAVKIAGALAEAGFPVDLDYIMKLADGGSVGKPHIARALVAAGHAPDVNSVFKRFLEEGMPGYVAKKKASLESAVHALQGCNAVPVLAHPSSLLLGDEKEYHHEIARFREMGVEGIEVYASMHGRREVSMFKKIAEELNLLVTGGSDFHGDKNERLGYYGDRRVIPDSILGPLLERGSSSSIMR